MDRQRDEPADGISGQSAMKQLPTKRLREILETAKSLRILVVGDLMLDQFVWGNVRRISPEAPVPVVEFEKESFMPGGAANVARNLSDLRVHTELLGGVGKDDAAQKLRKLLQQQGIGCQGILSSSTALTSIKTRI